MTVPSTEETPWTSARERAKHLRGQHPFSGDVFCLYLALVDVWEEAWAAARAEQPADLASWAAERVLPKVVAVTHECGPQPLAESLEPVFDRNAAEKLLAAWLAGDELVPVERYLARTSLRAPLAAVDAGLACAADPSPRGGRRCPRCGGPPQFSFHTATGDRLVSGRRRLQCARCADSWNFSSSTCAYCGETEGARRTVYTEQHSGPVVGRAEGDGDDDGDGDGPVFPHIRVEACATCERYVIDVDLGTDPRAVPEVDELAALPLDLYAAEQGFSKITPNVMGF